MDDRSFSVFAMPKIAEPHCSTGQGQTSYLLQLRSHEGIAERVVENWNLRSNSAWLKGKNGAVGSRVLRVPECYKRSDARVVRDSIMR